MFWTKHSNSIRLKVTSMSGGGDGGSSGGGGNVFGGTGSVNDPTSSAHAHAMAQAEAALGGGPSYDHYVGLAAERDAADAAAAQQAQQAMAAIQQQNIGSTPFAPNAPSMYNVNPAGSVQFQQQGFGGYDTPAPTGNLPQQQVGWGFAPQQQQQQGGAISQALEQQAYQSMSQRPDMFRQPAGLKEQFAGLFGFGNSVEQAGLKIPGGGAITMDEFLATHERRPAAHPGVYKDLDPEMAEALSMFGAIRDKQGANIMGAVPGGSLLASLAGASPIGLALTTGAKTIGMIANRNETLDQVGKMFGMSPDRIKTLDELDTQIRSDIMRDTPSRHHGSFDAHGNYRPALRDDTGGPTSDAGIPQITLPGTGGAGGAGTTPADTDGLSFGALIPTLKLGGRSLAEILAENGGNDGTV